MHAVIGRQFECIPGITVCECDGVKGQDVQVAVHHRHRNGRRVGRAVIQDVGCSECIGIVAGQHRSEGGGRSVDMGQGGLFGPRAVRQAPIDAHAPAVALLIHGLHARGQHFIGRDLEAHVVHVGRINDHGEVDHGTFTDRNGH